MTPPDPTPQTVTINFANTSGDPASYTGSVNEDGTSPDLPRIRASVDNAAQGSIIEYGFLESGGGRLTTSEGGVFQINSSTGAISVADSSLLDYETTPRYELTVSVLYDADSDPRTTTDEVTRDVQVVIDVGDVLIELADADGNPVSSYTGSVDEDGGNADLPTISASVGNAAQGSVIEYAFVVDHFGNVAILSQGGVFQINHRTGAISVADSSLLDYETTPRYELTVRVTYDADDNVLTADVTREMQVVIDVGDVLIELADADGNPVSSYTGSVDEDGGNADLPTISASVGNAAQGSVIEYAFVVDHFGNVAILSQGGVFQINHRTGAISVADSSLLDYETTPRYELTVRVTYDADDNVLTADVTREIQVVIDVNDVAGQSPAIIPDRQSFAHQDSYDPDDLGLTPMPDADPSAG